MKQALPKELSNLFDFYCEQRNNLPEEFGYGEAIAKNPRFFSVKDLQQYLNNPLLHPDWVHMVTAGQVIALDSACLYKTVQTKKLQFMDKRLINDELSKGGALVLEGLDIMNPSINAFLSRVDESLPCALVNCVAFFSQKQNEAYQGHCDSDDVLVFQLQGEKTWQLFQPQQRRYFNNADQSDSQLGPVKHEFTLRPGDALYVRAGVPHRCLTPGDYSLHLSFDLGDRTVNVEQITSEAVYQYNNASALPYEPASKVVDQYVKILKSTEFQAALAAETQLKRKEAIIFRDRIAHSATVSQLSKFK